MAELDGKTALVTGGTSGIGLASARRLAQEGAQVFLTGRRQDTIDQAVAQLHAVRAASATGVRADVSNQDDLNQLFSTIRDRGHGLDVVFANAGGGEFAALQDITWEHYTNTFNTNVGGTLFTVQGALPLLNPAASIILSSSSTDIKGSPSFSVYAASKAAIRSLTRSWAAELAERGIRVNCVAPGPTGTPGLAGLATDPTTTDVLLRALASGVPMKRLGTPEEIAETVLFLAGNRSTFITGAVLYVDGGSSQI